MMTKKERRKEKEVEYDTSLEEERNSKETLHFLEYSSIFDKNAFAERSSFPSSPVIITRTVHSPGSKEKDNESKS
jgi:hypothetical protein